MSEPTSRTALVLGATGGIGGETAALARHGWTIRALSRNGQPANDATGWEWVEGEAMDQASIVHAVRGVSAIIHAVNPPGYRNWGRLVVPMIENTVAAARASGARVVLPGTVYNYGPDAFLVLHEDSPQRATTHKGRVRTELERRLEDAAKAGVRSLIVRFGDFFGPKPGQNWFSQGLVKPGGPVTAISYPGSKGVGHGWAYLPDAGETFARLLDRDAELGDFASFHFRGHWDADGTQMAAAIRRATANPSVPVKVFPWTLFRAGSLVSETMRELYAVRPLWGVPLELDHAQLVFFLGAEPHTPLDEAVSTTLRGLGLR